jgi:hypothetical protein
VVTNVRTTGCQYGRSFLGTTNGPESNVFFKNESVADVYGVYFFQNPAGTDWPNLNNFYGYLSRSDTGAAWYNSGGDGNWCYGCDIEDNTGYGIEMLSGQGGGFIGGWLEGNGINMVIAPTGNPVPSGYTVQMFGVDAYTSQWTTTCSISTSAPTTLTVGSNAGMALGQAITVQNALIGPASLNTWITAISGTTITLHDPATNTTTGFNCNTANPTGYIQLTGESRNISLGHNELPSPVIDSMTWGLGVFGASLEICSTTNAHNIILEDSGGNTLWTRSCQTGDLISSKGKLSAPVIWDTGLTSGNCVQASTNGLLTTTSGPCGTGSGSGTVTSVTFTGDGVVDSSTPSTAVTTSGTVPATLNTQAANTVFGNFTGSTAAPAFTATTGTGSPVSAINPTLVTPALGTPTSGVATNLTGTAAGLTAGNATLAAGLTGSPNITVGTVAGTSQTMTGSGSFNDVRLGVASTTIDSVSGSNLLIGRTTQPTVAGAGAWDLGIATNGFRRMYASGFISVGTKFTTSGCSVSSTTGGATAGLFTLGANSCTVIITMNGATGLTAPNGWTCNAHDRTTVADIIGGETSSTTTTASIAIPVTVGSTDVISFSCMAF